MRNRVYIGPANLANISKDIEKSFKSVGIKADFITWPDMVHEFGYNQERMFKLFDPPPFKIFGKNIFYFINKYLLKPFYFIYCILRYDTFIFIKPITFFKNNVDIKILHRLNKRVVTIFAGCADRDVHFSRSPYYVCNTCQDIEKQKSNMCDHVEKKKESVYFFEKYSNYILGFADLVSYVQDKSKVFKVPIGMDEIKYKLIDKLSDNEKLVISHLPSNPYVKGTQYVKPILEKLSKEENVEIIIKEEFWSREKIISTLEKTHILIDSLVEYTFGKLSLEGIQYGCVVLNAYPDWIAQYYKIPPVVKVNPDNLYKTLKKLIHDKNLMNKYAERSEQAFNKYFTYKAAGKYYKEKLELK